MQCTTADKTRRRPVGDYPTGWPPVFDVAGRCMCHEPQRQIPNGDRMRSDEKRRIHSRISSSPRSRDSRAPHWAQQKPLPSNQKRACPVGLCRDKCALATGRGTETHPKGTGHQSAPAKCGRTGVIGSVSHFSSGRRKLRLSNTLHSVEDSGIEPLTSCMPCKRSPS